jgi:drug/metabolite transporter (DMT)-like permease
VRGTTPSADEDRVHEGSRSVLIALILSSVTLAAVAQLTLKTGVNHVTASGDGAGLQLSGSSLRSLLTSPIVWAGLVLFGLSAVVWLFALSRASLSFAYPFASLSYVLILIFGRLVLHEQVTPLRLAGVALIVAGIVLVAQTPHT